MNNKPLPIYGKGINSREWIHVDDHCRALEMLSIKGKIGDNYNIGSGKNLTNIKLVKIIIKLIKKKFRIGKKVKIQFVKDRPGHDIRYALDSKKILKQLRWKAKTNFEKGIRETFIWYLKNNLYYKQISKKDIVKRLGN